VNATESVATDPEAMTKKLVQPYRKAGSGPNASRKYTYRPPASGFDAPSSAYVNAPSRDNTPPIVQMRSAAPGRPPVSRNTTLGTR